MSPVEIPSFTSTPFTIPDDLGRLSDLNSAVRVWLQKTLGVPEFDRSPLLNAATLYQTDEGGYWRRKVRYGNDSDDVVWAWLLVPKLVEGPMPAVICLPGSFMTPNWGKDGPAGLAGPWDPGNPEAYGADLARLGYVTLCPDYPCAGERTSPGLKPYDTTALDDRHPDWTRVGLSTWDVSRAVDFLLQLPEVDQGRIGCTGWSQGGQMTLLGAAFDTRVSVLVSACGWSPLRGLEGPVVENLVQSYNFPNLAGFCHGQLLPFDFDHVAALIAPRPFLDLRASEDQFFPNSEETRAVTVELAHLYDRLGAAGQFSCKWFGGRHAYSAHMARETQAWLHRHLYEDI